MAEEGCDVEQSQSREGQGPAEPGKSQGSKGLKGQPLDSYRHVMSDGTIPTQHHSAIVNPNCEDPARTRCLVSRVWMVPIIV